MLQQLQALMQNPQMFQQKFSEFASKFQNSKVTPQQMVQNLLNSGKMTQEQFNQFRNIANQLTGMRL